jgi:hypothetical protein
MCHSNRVLTANFSKASVLNLNAVLLESPEALAEPPFAEETVTIVCQGVSHKNVRASIHYVLQGRPIC